MKRALAIAVGLASASAASAQELKLQLPIDCVLGTDCYVQNYVDRIPIAGYNDFTCGSLSYDGHKGTDFALPSREHLSRNVAVLAAADGVVFATRTTMKDHDGESATEMDFDGKQCGNGVVLRHGNNWQTQYCHLKAGSIEVTQGQRVVAGQPIGTVGMTGLTEFPHLHIAVRHERRPIDPFAPTTRNCGERGGQMWENPIAYQPGGIISAGFSTELPTLKGLRAGWSDRDPITADAPAIIAYGHLYGARVGDEVLIFVEGPEGKLVEKRHKLTKTQAVVFRASGKKKTKDSWPSGHYIGSIMILRDGRILDQQNLTAVIE